MSSVSFSGYGGRILRLYTPESAGPTAVSPHMRLGDFYRTYFIPRYLIPKDRDKKTIRIYDQAVRQWAEFTGDPLLYEITDEHCEKFVACLKRQPGRKKKYLATESVRKICRTLQTVLHYTGQRTPLRRKAARILAEVPYIERPDPVCDPPDEDFTLTEIGKWLGACVGFRKTRNCLNITSEEFYSRLIRFTYNTALRIDTIMSLEWSMVGRKKENWLLIPHDIYKRHQKGGEFYLNQWARESLAGLPRIGKRIWPWRGWPNSQSWMQEKRRDQLAQTDIPEHRRFGFHGLRGALITWLAERNPMVARIVAGHSTNDVTQKYYVNPKIIVDLLEQVPQPTIILPQPKQP